MRGRPTEGSLVPFLNSNFDDGDDCVWFGSDGVGAAGRFVDGRQPDDVDAQFLQVVEPVDNAAQVADALAGKGVIGLLYGGARPAW